MKRSQLWFMLILMGTLSAPLFAEEGKEKDEALAAEDKEAEEEDTANIGKDFAGGYELIARGKFKLYGEGESENPKVIGLFSADGKIYQCKVENEGLKKDLAPVNGKEVGLAGKLRNKGKYFVIQMLMNSAPPPDSFRNPRGL